MYPGRKKSCNGERALGNPAIDKSFEKEERLGGSKVELLFLWAFGAR
jgi:hypothetical protein